MSVVKYRDEEGNIKPFPQLVIKTTKVDITVDDELSDTSTNPVQNKVINTALNDKVSTVKVNNTEVTKTNGVVNITVPTNNNQLTNGAGYQTSSQVQTLINNALKGITGIDVKVVDSLPTTGVKGTLYLVPNSSSEIQNVYDEYIWVSDTSTFEKIGTLPIEGMSYSEAQIFKICHPVGSYYWSSDDLSPVDIYGESVGTWEKLSQARVLISAGSLGRKDLIAGDTGGEYQTYLTTDQLPSHTHSVTYSKSSTTSGGCNLTASNMPSHRHYFSLGWGGDNISQANVQVQGGSGVGFLVDKSGTSRNYTGYAGNGSSGANGTAHYHSITLTNTSVTSGSTGGDSPIDILPPYLAANCWHRTA